VPHLVRQDRFHIVSRRCCTQRQRCRIARTRITWIKINIRIQNFSNFTRRCSRSELHPNAIRGDHPRERQHPRSECPVCLIEADGVNSVRTASILYRCACNGRGHGLQCASVYTRPHTGGLRDYLLDQSFTIKSLRRGKQKARLSLYFFYFASNIRVVPIRNWSRGNRSDLK
jgi:hypothetical protein